MRKELIAVTCGALLVASLAGTAPDAHAEDATLNLTIKNHRFDPIAPTVPANTRIKVTFQNLDATTAEFMSDEFKGGKVATGGQTVTFFIGPLKPGTYEIHDEYAEAASKTKLVVK